MKNSIKIIGLDLKEGEIIKVTLPDKMIRFEVDSTVTIFDSNVAELSEVEYKDEY